MQPEAGARVDDLYVVCGQAQRSIVWLHNRDVSVQPWHLESTGIARHDRVHDACGRGLGLVCCTGVLGLVWPSCDRGAQRVRMTKVTERKTKVDGAHFINDIAQQYPTAERITLVMDNLNTHTPASLYEAFPAEQAKALWDRFEFVYTPKHGSWLNMAEIELNVMIAQCLNRRIDKIDTVRSEVAAWQASRDQINAKINWQFTSDHARIKLKRLYPTLDA